MLRERVKLAKVVTALGNTTSCGLQRVSPSHRIARTSLHTWEKGGRPSYRTAKNNLHRSCRRFRVCLRKSSCRPIVTDLIGEPGRLFAYFQEIENRKRLSEGYGIYPEFEVNDMKSERRRLLLHSSERNCGAVRARETGAVSIYSYRNLSEFDGRAGHQGWLKTAHLDYCYLATIYWLLYGQYIDRFSSFQHETGSRMRPFHLKAPQIRLQIIGST